MQLLVHALTPGDHYSPRTGSAIPTVVHGLASAAASDTEYANRVLLDASTFHPRYASAEPVEYTGVGYPTAWQRALDLGLTRVGLPRMSSHRSYRPLVDSLRDMPSSLVLAHNAPMLPGLLSGSPHRSIYYAHNDLPRGMSRREATWALGPCAAVVAVSTDLAQRISERVSPTIGDRISVVENGVDVDVFHPAPIAAGNLRLRVMFVGRIVPEKGADVLLRAAGLLERDDVEIVIVGSQGFDAGADLSPYERELRTLAATVPSPVEFRPFVDRTELPGLLRSADVFVAPSRWPEPSGLTIGEAMATGLPIVASAAGGIPEVLGDAGMLIPAGDHAALADGVGALADDESLRTEFGLRARARAESRSWERSWRQLRRVLETVG